MDEPGNLILISGTGNY